MANDDRAGAGARIAGAINLIGSLTTIAVALSPLVGGGLLVAALIAWLVDPALPFRTLLSGLPAAVLVGAIIVAISGINRRNRFSQSDQNRDWRILKVERQIVVNTPEHISYDYRVEARARNVSADTLFWQTAWTGTGDYHVLALSPEIAVHQDQLSYSFGEKFRLILNKPVRRGQTGRFLFRIETKGSKEQQRPYIGVTVRNQNGPKVSPVTIKFEDKAKVERVWVEEYIGGLTWPHTSMELGLVNRSVTFEIPRKLGRKYVICWHYQEAEGMNE